MWLNSRSSKSARGGEKYFKPDIDFLSYSNTKEAVDIIVSHLNDPMKLNKINTQAQKKAFSIIESNLYWNIIDSNLKIFSIIGFLFKIFKH